MSPSSHAAALASLRDEALADDACRDGRPRIVFGEGNADAALMLVGEAPGEVEERLGRPFVGPAGRLLDRALAAAGVDRADVWITNLVKSRSRARDDGSGTGRPVRTRSRPAGAGSSARSRPFAQR